ncbi:TIGR00153 family protein [Arhodomonas aquaeolei]|uniref:TIGR00153 family protein n=1 Tax=Arhodomonas aquaeolei TaxID=2369 RepID=UPI00216954BA|nr:TIGR00153 family protein [Arhodomonas aquaeolei]MCS4503563.1 TIGR00153 family protein [Arhodomonas aquaeolei]
MAPNFFSQLFGKSPVSPLQRHMAEVSACVEELPPFLAAVRAGDWATAEAHQQRIGRIESDADRLKHELRLQLPKGLMLPVARRDLLEVLAMQDKVANRAKDIAGLILGRRMTFPESVAEPMESFLQRSVDATRQARKAIDELDDLFETGFRGHEVDIVNGMLTELDRIESDTDRLQVTTRRAVFALEDELPPVHVMFIYRIIDWIGSLADRSQRVGSRLQLMLAR